MIILISRVKMTNLVLGINFAITNIITIWLSINSVVVLNKPRILREYCDTLVNKAINGLFDF